MKKSPSYNALTLPEGTGEKLMYVFTLLRRRCDCEGRYCRSSHSGTVVLLTQVLPFLSLRYCRSSHSGAVVLLTQVLLFFSLTALGGAVKLKSSHDDSLSVSSLPHLLSVT